jgi:hypothetical protein
MFLCRLSARSGHLDHLLNKPPISAAIPRGGVLSQLFEPACVKSRPQMEAVDGCRPRNCHPFGHPSIANFSQGGVRRGIAAYGAGFLLGVVLSILWAEAVEATAFNINSGMGVVGAFLGPWFGLAIAIAFANKSPAKVGHSRPKRY